MKDQVEMLTAERSAQPTNAPVVPPVSSADRNQLLDSVANESVDLLAPGEGRTLQGVETAMEWVTYGVVVVVAIVLTWSVGAAILRYMMPQ